MVLNKLVQNALLLTACLFNIEQVLVKGAKCPEFSAKAECCGILFLDENECKKLKSCETSILPDECSGDGDCQTGETCAYVNGGEYFTYYADNKLTQDVSNDESLRRCTASDKCGKVSCGEYTVQVNGIKGSK